MTNRDKLLVAALEHMRRNQLEGLIKLQQLEGVGIGKFVAQAMGEMLVRAQEAVKATDNYTHSLAARIGLTRRAIIRERGGAYF